MMAATAKVATNSSDILVMVSAFAFLLLIAPLLWMDPALTANPTLIRPEHQSG